MKKEPTEKDLKEIEGEEKPIDDVIAETEKKLEKAKADAKVNPKKAPVKKTPPTKKTKAPGYDKKYSTYSSRISYPATYSAPLKKLSKDMKKSIKQLYTLAVKDFLLKHNCLPSNNNNKRS